MCSLGRVQVAQASCEVSNTLGFSQNTDAEDWQDLALCLSMTAQPAKRNSAVYKLIDSI